METIEWELGMPEALISALAELLEEKGQIRDSE